MVFLLQFNVLRTSSTTHKFLLLNSTRRKNLHKTFTSSGTTCIVLPFVDDLSEVGGEFQKVVILSNEAVY